MNDLEQAIGILYKKKGKKEMSEKEFVFSASMDFRWFTPKEAQKLMDISLDSQLLESKKGALSPNFDTSNIKIPKGYKPKPDILKIATPPKGIFLKIVDIVSKEKEIPRKEVIAMMNSQQEKMNVDIEVAALVVAERLGIDINKHISNVEKELDKRYKSD